MNSSFFMPDILLVVLVSLSLAYAVSEIFRRFNLPRVVGQILAGIILGFPVIKNYFFTQEALSVFSFISNIGIILLFFFVGLEIDLKKFRKNYKKASFISLFNTLVPLSAGFFFSKFAFHFNNTTSLIIAISLSVSSQAISLDILEELNLLKSKIGNLIVTSGTVDDVFELVIISILLIVFHTTLSGETNFLKIGFDILSFILMVILFRVSLIPTVLNMFEKEKSQATLFMGALIIVLLMAYVSEVIGIGSLLGALIAGMLIRQTLLTGEDRRPWRRNEISHSIHIISFGFLIPIFFVSVGLNTDIFAISSNLILVIVLILINFIGTIGGTVIGVMMGKGTLEEGLIVGWGVSPKGDTELVIATLALNAGLINVDIFTAIITVAIVSTFVAPIVFKLSVKQYLEINAKN
ncbi:cation:proton antiporter [Candidatus Woesearchaeota archaeon]|nr:cation:proton antiporter [Candidatus Woesearchaeota archaeon]